MCVSEELAKPPEWVSGLCCAPQHLTKTGMEPALLGNVLLSTKTPRVWAELLISSGSYNFWVSLSSVIDDGTDPVGHGPLILEWLMSSPCGSQLLTPAMGIPQMSTGSCLPGKLQIPQYCGTSPKESERLVYPTETPREYPSRWFCSLSPRWESSTLILSINSVSRALARASHWARTCAL